MMLLTKTVFVRCLRLASYVLIAAIAISGPVKAASILSLDDLYRTGLDATGNVVSPFLASADANWTLEGPDFALGAANVINKNTLWIAAPIGSEWIGRADGSQGNTPDATYMFSTIFDLSGFDHTTASIFGTAASDDVATILLNGNDVGTIFGFGSLTDFIINTGFIEGINTLQFSVLNSSFTGINPMGLLVADIGGIANLAVSAVPLPPSAILFGTALLGLVGIRRRKKRT